MRAYPVLRAQHLPGCLMLLAGAVAGPAHGEVPGAACLRIADPDQRLACFDEAIGAAASGKTDGSPETTAATAPAASDRVPAADGTAGAGVPDTSAGSPSTPPRHSLIDTAWGFLPESKPAYVRLHQANYLLPVRYTNDVNIAPYLPLFDAFQDDADFENVEAKFQLSVKGRLLASDDRRWGLWFAYSQQSQWQVYGTDISRPFRETNYVPEVFGSFRPGLEFGDWQWNLLNFGYTHQSNGRADPISRSWDRLFVEAGIERDNFVLLARAWTRIEPEDGEDDNPDIVDFYGHGELNAYYVWRDNRFNLMARGNLDTGKGAAQFTWASRPVLGPLRGYLQVFTGYGESMIDYDWRQTTVGVGFTLNERF